MCPYVHIWKFGVKLGLLIPFLAPFHFSDPFLLQEEEFEVYEPYCANYTNATELLLAEEQNLMVSLDMCKRLSQRLTMFAVAG
jgi:hypothetical protein